MKKVTVSNGFASARPRLLFALFVAGLSLQAEHASAELATPDCTALATWAAGFDRNDEWQPNTFSNRHRIPRLFAADATTALFGKPLTDWSEGDAAAVREVVLACRQATSDRTLSGSYNAIQSAILNRVMNFTKAVPLARERVGAAMKALGDQPPSLPLLQLHSTLAGLTSADGLNALQRVTNGLPGSLAAPARELAGAVVDLPEADIASLVSGPARDAASEVRQGVVEAMAADVTQVPANVPGLATLDRMALAVSRDHATALGPEAVTRLQQEIADRQQVVAEEIANALVAQIGQVAPSVDAFEQIDQLADDVVLRQLPQAQAALVRDAAQARRQTLADELLEAFSAQLTKLPASDASLSEIDRLVGGFVAWPASAAPFKPRFEEVARTRREAILGVVNKAEAGSLRGRIYESADKRHKIEFVDRKKVFVHESGHTAAGTYAEEKDGRVTLTVNGNSIVLSREGRRLLGWQASMARIK